VAGLATLWASLPLWGWLVLALCAPMIGFSKTALGGLGLIAVVLTSQVVATKDSTAVVLVMLLVGDLVATWTYRHDVDWRLILRLIPPVLVGIGAGALFLNWVDGPTLKRTMGVILLVLLVIGLLVLLVPGQQVRQAPLPRRHRLVLLRRQPDQGALLDRRRDPARGHRAARSSAGAARPRRHLDRAGDHQADRPVEVRQVGDGLRCRRGCLPSVRISSCNDATG
jgi:hypothetical protein